MNDLSVKYMRRAIKLALKGQGWTNPNPMVGAVIVKDGRIIGEGYHEKYGQLHAEREALKNAKEDPRGATIYVTLEPCSHQGKQPPCADALIEAGVSRVVIGSRDPNPLVSGRGVKRLRDQGIEVVEDYLKDECDKINSIFFHYITTRTPYVTLKYAMTMDGKTATKTGASKWITGEESRHLVHHMRHAHMAILSGIGTVLKDDPMLNARIKNPNHPARIICDSKLRIPMDSQIVKSAGEIETIVSCGTEYDFEKRAALKAAGIEVIEVPDETGSQVDIKSLLKYLGEERGLDSVFAESGGTLTESLLRQGLVNRVVAFIAPKIFGGAGHSPVDGIGVELPDEAYQFRLVNTEYTGDDVVLYYDKV